MKSSKAQAFLGKISGTKCNRADRHTDRFQSIFIAFSQGVSVFLWESYNTGINISIPN